MAPAGGDTVRKEIKLKTALDGETAKKIDVYWTFWWHRRWERLPLRFSIWVGISIIVSKFSILAKR